MVLKQWSLKLRVLRDRILRQIFGTKRDENREWRRLHNEDVKSLYCSPNIVRVVKFRRLRWNGALSNFQQVNLQERNF